VDEKRSFEHDAYAFHYEQADGIIYMVMADKQTTPRLAFSFLSTIRQRFESQYGERAHTAIAFQFNADFSRILSSCMQQANGSEAADDRFTAIRSSLSDVKEQMVDNIDRVIMRGERIDLLVDKSGELEEKAISFKKQSKGLRRGQCLKNAKWTLLAAIIIAMLILFIVMAYCGANFSKCKA
jgi:vesicle-associated membrane protein 7